MKWLLRGTGVLEAIGAVDKEGDITRPDVDPREVAGHGWAPVPSTPWRGRRSHCRRESQHELGTRNLHAAILATANGHLLLLLADSGSSLVDGRHSLTSTSAGQRDLAGVQNPDFPAIEKGPRFSSSCPKSCSRAHFFAGVITALRAFRALQRTHCRPGIRQLAATVQAHRIAGLVQREWTGLVAVNASK